MGKHRVVIVGSGFGGLFAARNLANEDVEIILLSDTTHHLFQPLLYQVATGILSEGEIAPSTREILKRQKNVKVLLGTVEDIDPESQQVVWRHYGQKRATRYDTLILAAGVGQSYFGNDHFATFAPGMKSIDDALELRARIFRAFEQAEVSDDPEEIQKLLTFVVVGAGPTGVEMAGQIRELSSKTLPKEFRNIDTTKARVILVEGGSQPLPSFGSKLGEVTLQDLSDLGIEFLGNTLVTDIGPDTVTVRDKDGNEELIPSTCKVWAAGVQGPPIARVLSERTGAELDRAGRVLVEPDLSVKGYPNLYVVGDMMSLEGVPGVAQGAIQGARFVTRRLKDLLAGRDPSDVEFSYNDKGSMATIARSKAVASIGPVNLHGFSAWLAWSFLHVLYITGFKSRVSTLFHWAVSFASNARSERTSTNQQMVGRLALDHLGERVSSLLIKGASPEEILVRAMDLEQLDYERAEEG
ncbi:MAG: NAD(P)/FAD-dependent oxidoreductase [Scrofimicrobium sp.]